MCTVSSFCGYVGTWQSITENLNIHPPFLICPFQCTLCDPPSLTNPFIPVVNFAIVSTRQTGGPLDHTSFSLQLPQAAVQLPPPMLLERYKDNRVAFGTLPTGTTLTLSSGYLAPNCPTI